MFPVSGLNLIFFVIANISVLVTPIQLSLPSIRTQNYQNYLLLIFVSIYNIALFFKFGYRNHKSAFVSVERLFLELYRAAWFNLRQDRRIEELYRNTLLLMS